MTKLAEISKLTHAELLKQTAKEIDNIEPGYIVYNNESTLYTVLSVVTGIIFGLFAYIELFKG